MITLCIILTGCSKNNADNYKKEDYGIFDMYDLFTLQATDEYDHSACIKCLNSIEATEDFCNGQGIIIIDDKSVTLSEALNKKLLTVDQVECLVNNNIVKHYRIPYVIYKIGEVIFSIFKGIK